MGTAISEQLAVMGELPRHWWVVALRGLAAIIFGVLAFIWPGPTLAVLIVLYGAYAIVDGVLALYAAVRSGDNRWTFVIEGVIGIAAGLVAFVWPGITALALLFVIAAWAILTGIMEAIAGVRLRRAIDNEWMLIDAIPATCPGTTRGLRARAHTTLFLPCLSTRLAAEGELRWQRSRAAHCSS